MSTPVKIRSEELSPFLTALFTHAGLSRRHSIVVVDQLVTASIRGTDTHGIVLVERYINDLLDGKISTRPAIRMVRQSPSTALIDGGFGAGQYVAAHATKIAISKASRNGVGAVSVVNVSHCGSLAYYAMMICAKKMAGVVFTNSDALAAPMGGKKRIFGTNPFCFAFPFDEYPLILDAATTLGAGMKVVLASKEGKSIPAGWAIDRQGSPTTDPKEALEGALLPFGGHKGYGIMLMAEIFSAVLSGGYLSTEIPSGRDAQGGFYVQALDIRKMRTYSSYLRDVGRLVEATRGSVPSGGAERVHVPGELEANATIKRRKEGIPVDRLTWEFFLKISRDFGLQSPSPVK